MSNKIKNIFEIFKSTGMLFPTNPEEIDEFEKNNDFNSIEPKNWDNPINIIKNGTTELKNFNTNIDIPNSDIQNLSMVAREGKTITDDVRKKMIEDRKNANRK